MTNTMANGSRWYVFCAHTRSEGRACNDIEDIGFRTFLPMAKRWKSRRGHKSPHEEPLFRGYGFVHLDLGAPGWGAILDSKRVRNLLPNDERPIAVDDQFINSLRLAEKLGVFDKTKPPPVGIEVEITSGPFQGYIGRIARKRAEDRVDVLLRLFGGMRQVSVPIMELRELEA